MNKKYKMLIVDDNHKNIQLSASILSAENIEVDFSKSGAGALEMVKNNDYDLILLDIMMPELNGYEVCQIIKNDIKTKDIPIIFLSAKSDSESIAYGFEVGGEDFISKPFNVQELKARVVTRLELGRAMQDMLKLNRELSEKNVKLQEAFEIVERLSRTDSLTGLPNRRLLTEKIEYEIIRSKRNNRHFSLMILDIDDFKIINDTYGHLCGDEVLKAVSNTIRNSTREQDIIGRWGGEEFLVVAPETSIDGGIKLAEKIRAAIENIRINYEEWTLSRTVSIGVSEYEIGEDMDMVIKNADEKLYEGKKKGKNIVVF